MRVSEYLRFSVANLAEMKLRTALTTVGVAVGIGALTAMIGFGKGAQKNVTQGFEALDLFNTITVFPAGELFPGVRSGGRDLSLRRGSSRSGRDGRRSLDDAAIAEIETLSGVDVVFPEIRFPAMIGLGSSEEFRLVQVVPAGIAASKLVKLQAGRPFRDDEEAAVISPSLVRQMGFKDAASAVGSKLRISSITFDFGAVNPLDLSSILQGKKLPFKTEESEFTVAGVTESFAFLGPTPIESDILIPSGTARRIPRLPFTNVWDLFRAGGEGTIGYSAVNVRLASAAAVDRVETRIRQMGFSTFALADQFAQVKKSFIYMDMMLAAVGMIAIFVAALGIINTMVMSILERYSEIGIMKAVGASRRNIKTIFFFESCGIGFMGGVFGLALGWVVSLVINRIINDFLAKQGLPDIQYFSFPLWLCLGAVLFAVGVSLAAGIYPAIRAATVDPVVALRHE